MTAVTETRIDALTKDLKATIFHMHTQLSGIRRQIGQKAAPAEFLEAERQIKSFEARLNHVDLDEAAAGLRDQARDIGTKFAQLAIKLKWDPMTAEGPEGSILAEFTDAMEEVLATGPTRSQMHKP